MIGIYIRLFRRCSIQSCFYVCLRLFWDCLTSFHSQVANSFISDHKHPLCNVALQRRCDVKTTTFLSSSTGWAAHTAHNRHKKKYIIMYLNPNLLARGQNKIFGRDLSHKKVPNYLMYVMCCLWILETQHKYKLFQRCVQKTTRLFIEVCSRWTSSAKSFSLECLGEKTQTA